MQTEVGFPPLLGAQPKILILGSMPSVKSLENQQYYAHPRNAFWPIMSTLFNIDLDSNYDDRCHTLTKRGVAVWDVLKSCQRKGSLDSAIERDSIVVNNFVQLFADFPSIKQIYFNGGAAEQLFKKHVLNTLNKTSSSLPMFKLPSTSPAHAAMTLRQKTAVWQEQIGQHLTI
jgi:hypoxanthine-DNA glycosylase